MSTIYLDYAAATPVDPMVFDAMKPFFTEQFANPSSLYSSARVTREALVAARASVANTLGAKPTEIIFTAGATESINLAIQGVMQNFPDGHMVTTAIEHEAVLETAQLFDCSVAPVNPLGVVDHNDIIKIISEKTVLVSVMMANNEVGTIQPIKEIAAEIAKIRAQRQASDNQLPLYLHTDAAQAGTTLDLHVSRLGIDLLTLNGGKMYGPKQSGILYVRTGVQLKPLIYGGGQERGMRSGTENVAFAVGFAKALELAQTTRKAEAHRLTGLRDQLQKTVTGAIPQIIVNGDQKRRLPHNLNITLLGLDGEAAVLYLDNAGVQASTGSACSIGSDQPSHVLLAMGRTPAEANASLRFTLGKDTTEGSVQQAAAVIIQTLQHLA
jgi:cysteine desulfurase